MAIVDQWFTHPHVRAQLFPNLDAAQLGYNPLADVQLGSAEDDVRRILSLIPGASAYYNSLVALIQQKAKEGAEQAIPKIKAEVESTVKPYVIAAFLLGFGGFLFGISTYMLNRRTA